jgi:hypothetical protein
MVSWRARQDSEISRFRAIRDVDARPRRPP